jgi:TRAP-type C4-dicarboxylate transport system permease large subunit
MRLEGHGINALGAVLVPWQKSLGYPGAFYGTTVAAAWTIDILIQRSFPLNLYTLVPFYAVGLVVLGLITYVPAHTLHPQKIRGSK